MRRLLLSLGMLLVAALPSYATQITAFSQNSSSNTLTATQNGAQTATSLSVVDASVTISQLFGQVTPIIADFDLSANSTDSAVTVVGLVVQHYSGSFCLTSGPGCSGTNYLSGAFTDAAVGRAGGPGLVVNVNNPPDSLTLSSDVIASSELNPPSTFNLGFSNLIPVLAQCGDTICSFTASVVGDVSATAAAFEPSSLAVMGVGLLGLTVLRSRRRNQV